MGARRSKVDEHRLSSWTSNARRSGLSHCRSPWQRRRDDCELLETEEREGWGIEVEGARQSQAVDGRFELWSWGENTQHGRVIRPPWSPPKRLAMWRGPMHRKSRESEGMEGSAVRSREGLVTRRMLNDIFLRGTTHPQGAGALLLLLPSSLPPTSQPPSVVQPLSHRPN